jgi:hypothetical protein
MDVIERPYGLEFDQHAILHKQVRRIVAHDHAVIGHTDGMLLSHTYAGLTKLVSQGVLIDLLQGPAAKRVAYAETAGDDHLRQCSKVVGVSVFFHASSPLIPNVEYVSVHENPFLCNHR